MYKVEVKNKGGMEFQIKSEHGEFMTDTEGKHIVPLEAFLGSLGACTGYFVEKFLKKSGIEYAFFTITVSGELAKDKGYYFKDIDLSVDLDGAVIDDLKKESLLEFMKNCPAHNTLKNSPSVNLKII